MAKIDTLSFMTDSKGMSPGETVSVPNILLVVGPNESGKTLALALITGWYDGSFENFDQRIFSNGTFRVFSKPDASEFLKPMQSKIDSEHIWRIWTGDPQGSIANGCQIDFRDFCSAESFKNKNWRSSNLSRMRLCPNLETMANVLIDTDARAVVPDGEIHSLHQLLLSDKKRREKVSKIIQSATGFNVVVQPGADGKFKFLFHHESPPEEDPGYILSKELRDYYSTGRSASLFGSGLKAFFGLALSVFPFEHKLIAIDEPELHLHPPLVRRVAQELVKETIRRDGQLIVSTHSPDFVTGCITSTEKIAMVRLTYAKATGKATAKVISQKDLKPFVADRIIRNTDALSGIFHECVIVVEGVFDKIVYSEFNRCLADEGKSREIRDVHFVAAGSCAAVINVANVVRATGTPVAMILDFDVLRLGWSEEHLSKIGLPKCDHLSMLTSIGECQKIIENIAKDSPVGKSTKELLKQGISMVDEELRQSFMYVIKKFAKYGLFIAELGDLESMLASDLKFSRNSLSKENIVMDIGLKKLEKKDYEIPHELAEHVGIWGLLCKIRSWIALS